MGNDVIFKCCICEADFHPGGLDENGKCASCRVAYPTVKNKKEAMALNRPEIHLNKKLDAEDVRQIVKEELNAFKAEQSAASKVDNMAKARDAKKDKKDDDKGDKNE